MASDGGTPKTLHEAIEDGLRAGRISTSDERFIQAIEGRVVDYLAQRFSVESLDADDAVGQALIRIFERLKAG